MKIWSLYTHEWGLLKYIEGPGLDEHGILAIICAPSNIIEHKNAVWAAEPWMTANNQALSRIVAALSGHQLLLVQNATYTKDAWESLKENYQPQNSICAATLKRDIITYCCTPDMNIAKWLVDMQNLFSSLCDLELERMSDRKFTLAILDLMPHNHGWRKFASSLWTKAREADVQNLPLKLLTYITSIRDEHWYCTKDTNQNNSLLFSAHIEAEKKTLKRPHPADIVASNCPAAQDQMLLSD